MTLTIASNAEDSAAAERVVAHHRVMLDEVRHLVEAVILAAAEGRDPYPARDALVQWCRDDLLPHAKAEEDVLYPVAHTITPQLIDTMIAEHAQLASLIDELGAQAQPVRIAAASRALLAVLDSHIVKENEHMLPLLAADPSISVSALLESMHGALDAPADDHTCNCHDEPEPDHPVLDARAVPHAIRHATIFGALDAVGPGKGLILVAPHDPLPMLAQLEKRSPETFSVSYLERGPEAWRLSIVREASV
ncbi:MAG: DUF2249 domain-containing protein [Aeromicrobium sp.]